MMLIDFDHLSPKAQPYYASSSLKILSASFSGGVPLLNGVWIEDTSTVYNTSPDCVGCSSTITIDFAQPISNFSVLLLNGNYQVVTFAVSDDQGGQQQISLQPYGYFNDVGTLSLAENNIRHVTISGSGCFGIDNVQFRPSGPVLLDPVQSGWVIGGPQVTTNTDLLAQGGVIVQAVAADGVTQALLRIPANSDGEPLSVSVEGSNSGALFALGGSPQSAQPNLEVTAYPTAIGPMAFAIYLPPPNYALSLQDYSDMRTIPIQIQSRSNPNYSLTASFSVLRPPVTLVHGLWGKPEDWAAANFTIPINLYMQPVDYYRPLLQPTATYPSYPSWILNLHAIPTSALGLNYNAGLINNPGDISNPGSVNRQIRHFILDFREGYNAAAVTADVVAHSMGGIIVRTMALDSSFGSNDTYGNGPVDKLITIGTPHLGSPLATDLLQDASSCVRDAMAIFKNASFVTVTTGQGTSNGAVGDLQGDGVPNGYLSPALTQLADAGSSPFPMALISATTNSSNLSNLSCGPYYCKSWWLKEACINLLWQDPLAIALTPTGWDTLFGQANDAVVPILSQLDGRVGGGGPNTPTLTGVIHSPGLPNLDFRPPSELEPGSGVPAQVLNLLNEPLDSGDFHGARTGGH